MLKGMKRYLLLAAVVLLPFVTFAADPFFGPIVPQCAGDGICDICDFMALLNNLLRFAVAFAVMVSTLMFVYAGILYVTASTAKANIDSAKRIFWNVFLGLVLILAAWLIVDLVMKVFTGQSLDVRTQLRCDDVQKIKSPEGGLINTNGDVSKTEETSTDDELVTNPTGKVKSSERLSDSDARKILSEAGIGIKPGASLEGVQKHTLDAIIQQKELCQCEVVITAATDGKHKEGVYSHGNGYKLDIRTRDEGAKFLEYVTSNLTYSESESWRDGTKVYLDSCGNEYAVESDHIDAAILYGKCGD